MLDNDVQDKHGRYEGMYTYQGEINEMPYWTDGENALWYMIHQGTTFLWLIGDITSDLGKLQGAMYIMSEALDGKCPNNEGNPWNWVYDYGDSNFVDSNDISIKCANEDDFCTSENPCGTNQGDCDNHDECQDGLVCGSNNCPDYLSFHSEFDCCYIPTVGDENFCKSGIPCGEDEGDCDSSNECQTNLICANNCPAYLGFNSDVNCCSDTYGCKFLTD